MGRKAYCDNAREIVEEAERQNMTRVMIAKICNVNPASVSNWKKNGVADPDVIRSLVDFLNKKPGDLRNAIPYTIPSSGLQAVSTTGNTTDEINRWLEEMRRLYEEGKRLGLIICPLAFFQPR